MTVTLMNRFSGDADVIEKVWRIHRPIIQKSGATQGKASATSTNAATAQNSSLYVVRTRGRAHTSPGWQAMAGR